MVFEPRARIDETAHHRLATGAVAGVVFSSLGLMANILRHPEQSWMHVAIGVQIVLCVAVYWLTKRGRIAFEQVLLVGSVLFATGVIVTAWGYGATESVNFALVMGVLMLAVGILHLYRRWLYTNLVLALGVWMPLAFAKGSTTIALALGCVAALAVCAYEVGTSYLVKLEHLRVRELVHERERNELREQLLHAQKLEAIGTLAGGVAHDVNNMLAAIVGFGDLVRERVEGDLKEDMSELLVAAQRGAELTRNLLAFSRRGNYKKEVLVPAALVDSVAKLLGRTLPKQVELVVSGSTELAIEGDAAQLTHALVNLCLNSSDAMQGRGRLSLEIGDAALDDDKAKRLGVPPGAYTYLTVADDGCGIAEEVRSRMFEPFFTTKAPGIGTGLGLAMVYGTVKSHDGAIEVDSMVGRGTTIRLYFPSTVHEVAAKAETSSLHSGTGKVLVIDDEPLVRSVTRRCMERAGFQVECAKDGLEGYERYARTRDFDVVLLDMGMPVMGGAECFAKLRELDPHVKVVIVSGYASEQEAAECLAHGALAFVDKPYRSEELVDVVTKVIAGAALHPGRVS